MKKRIPTYKKKLNIEKSININKEEKKATKENIAVICTNIINDPVAEINKGTSDIQIYWLKHETNNKLVLISLIQLLLDILPSYKINVCNKNDQKKEELNKLKISKDVQRIRLYERKLLDLYYTVIKRLFTMISNKDNYEMSYLSLQCLCKLYKKTYDFNYSKDICMVQMNQQCNDINKYVLNLIRSTQQEIFNKDIGGESIQLIVKCIENVFINRGNENIRKPLLEILQNIPQSTRMELDINTNTQMLKKCEEKIKKKNANNTKKTIKLGPGVHNWQKNQEKQKELIRKYKKKMKSGKLNKKDIQYIKESLEKLQYPFRNATTTANNENDAVINSDFIDHSKDLLKYQSNYTNILSIIFTIYFRYIKQAPTIGNLYKSNTIDKKDINEPQYKQYHNETSFQQVQLVVLEGIRKFSHLINVDLLLDLQINLKKILQQNQDYNVIDNNNTVDIFSTKQLSLECSQKCIYTAIYISKIYNRTIQIDMQDFYNIYYEQQQQLIVSPQSLETAQECWDIIVLQTNTINIDYIIKCCQRLVLISFNIYPHIYIYCIFFAIYTALNKYPRAKYILSNLGCDTTVANIDNLPHVSERIALWDLCIYKNTFDIRLKDIIQKLFVSSDTSIPTLHILNYRISLNNILPQQLLQLLKATDGTVLQKYK